VNIDFKKPKYILPLIILPFIFLFFYIFQSWGSPAKQKAQQALADSLSHIQVDQINPDMPDVSKDVAGGQIKDKFQSLQEAYKNDRDFSALATLDEKQEKVSDYSSAYSNSNLETLQGNRTMDSLRNSLDQNRANLDRNMQKMMSRANGASNPPPGLIL
jgi:hypothetical protein